MSQPENHYQVLWASDTRAAVKVLVVKARALGIATRLVGRLKELETLLQSQPTIFGEAQWVRGNVEDRLGVRDFVAVHYRVDKLARLVLVVRCNVLSGHGI